MISADLTGLSFLFIIMDCAWGRSCRMGTQLHNGVKIKSTQ
jgi:hypothetical protein